MDYYLKVGDEFTTKEDNIKILDELCKSNPGMTVKEFLESKCKIKMILV